MITLTQSVYKPQTKCLKASNKGNHPKIAVFLCSLSRFTFGAKKVYVQFE